MKLVISLGLLLLALQTWAKDLSDDQILVPSGKFVPFFMENKEKDLQIKSFSIDKYPVTNLQFNNFLKINLRYTKSKIPSVLIDQRYLEHWSSDLLTEKEIKEIGQNPVTNISWFLAKKYCQFFGKRLPLISEWEYASDSTNPNIMNELLDWYAKTGNSPLVNVGQRKPNKFGVHDMHGLIWEWVEDFASVMISSDSRSKGDRTDGFFCGGGSIGASDAKEYATFMRYGFRSGLKGNYCTYSLGFRCAKDIKGDSK